MAKCLLTSSDLLPPSTPQKQKSLLRVTTFHFSEVPCLYIACLPQTLKLYHIERLLQGIIIFFSLSLLTIKTFSCHFTYQIQFCNTGHLLNQWNGSLVPPDHSSQSYRNDSMKRHRHARWV